MSFNDKIKKKNIIDTLSSLYSDDKNYVFLLDCKHIDALNFHHFRKLLNNIADTKCVVVKNKINRIAIQNTKILI